MLTIEIEHEEDGRWIAEVVALPGVLAYGTSREEAVAKAEAASFQHTLWLILRLAKC